MMSSHGGKRLGSGPKDPVSPFGEKTSVIRVPSSIKSDVLVYLEAFKTNVKNKAPANILEADYIKLAKNPVELALPIYSGKVSAGQSRFPSPAQDYEQEELDLNKHLIINPPATFLYRVGSTQDSMIDAGIQPNCLLIVDRSITPKSSHIVIAEVDGESMVKRLYKWRGIVELRSENKEKNYPPIVFNEGQELIVSGVVTFNVNTL
jgi:DNA polymerase V